MITETMRRFGYPDSLLGEYEHWVVLLRHEQVTAGALVLACKHAAPRLPDVPAEAFAQLPRVTGDLELALEGAFAFEKINYLLLMMVDREVHFHVLPRYSGPRVACGATFGDRGWPRAPDLASSPALSPQQFRQLLDLLRSKWPR
jgi:diadenosine tetraphosphate (Ap4A) HIT family hydrolase